MRVVGVKKPLTPSLYLSLSLLPEQHATLPARRLLPLLSSSSLLFSRGRLEGWIGETLVLRLRGKGGPSLLVPSGL